MSLPEEVFCSARASFPEIVNVVVVSEPVGLLVKLKSVDVMMGLNRRFGFYSTSRSLHAVA